MPEKRIDEVEETVQEVQDNFIQEDIGLIPRFLGRLFTTNIIRRVFSYLYGNDPAGKSKRLACTPDGRLRTSTEPAGALTGTHGKVTVGVTATLVLAGDIAGLECGIINDSGVKIYFGFSNAVTTANGVPLRDGGAWITELYKGAIWCIVGSGTADIHYYTIK